jgi:heme exporter protein D
LFGLGLLAGLGAGLLIASVFSGFFWWWAVGATALGVALLILVPLTARR